LSTPPEILAPAGNLEKLEFAVMYGADAVYIGGQAYGLRAYAGNFSYDDMAKGIAFAHQHGVRVYVTANIIPHNQDLAGLPAHVEKVASLGADALIVADPGVLRMARQVAPDLEFYLSTQASNTNWAAAQFWADQGVDRIILAREVSLEDVGETVKRVPQLGFEVFVHGAMCVSYSGRCLLSNYLAGRDANRGACAGPCRWEYYLVEQKRPGRYFNITEDRHGTYIFNSRDLCMIEHVPAVVDTGVTSLKIEGRMKSVNYVASVVKVYREAVEAYCGNPDTYTYQPSWLEELQKTSHRGFTTGFYFNSPGPDDHDYRSSGYQRDYDFVGVVRSYDRGRGLALVEQRNKIETGEALEITGPRTSPFPLTVTALYDEDYDIIEAAPHPQQLFYLPVEREVEPYALVRRPS